MFASKKPAERGILGNSKTLLKASRRWRVPHQWLVGPAVEERGAQTQQGGCSLAGGWGGLLQWSPWLWSGGSWLSDSIGLLLRGGVMAASVTSASTTCWIWGDQELVYCFFFFLPTITNHFQMVGITDFKSLIGQLNWFNS